MLLNKERTYEFMSKHNLDALVATLPQNVTYFTGYASWVSRAYREWQRIPGGSNMMRQTYGVVTKDESTSPSLIVSIDASNYYAQHPNWVKKENVYTYGGSPQEKPITNIQLRPEERLLLEIMTAADRNTPTPAQSLVKALRQNNIDRGRVGLDMENLSPEVLETLKKEFPGVEFGNACQLIRLIRMVKTADEVECVKKALTFSENAKEEIIKNIRVGISERKLEQVAHRSIADQGGQLEFFNCPSGSRGYYSLFPPSDYKLQKGDTIGYDFGCIADGYHSDIGDCAVLGTPSKKQLEIYDAMTESMRVGEKLLQAGVKTSEIPNAMEKTLKKAGITPWPNVGHGVGLEIRDYPLFRIPPFLEHDGIKDDFVKGSQDIPLEEGMVLNLEVAHRSPGIGFLEIEYTYHITQKGARLIYPQQCKLLAL